MANTFSEYVENSSLFSFDTATGQIIPQTSDVLTSVKSMMSDIFGETIDLSSETPAGRLCEMIAIAIKRFCTTTAAFANQINPYYASGQMLDAIGSLFSVSRTGATNTVINVVLAGTTGTVIPSGSKISDSKGNSFTTDGAVTIPAGGSASTTATCEESGIVEVENGTVTNIDSAISGWVSVSNTSTQSVGVKIESDNHYRNRILISRWTGTAFSEAIRAQIERVDNVDDVIVIENGNTSDMYLNESKELVATQPSSGKYIKLKAHSVCPIVFGRSLTESDYENVADAIYETKSAGCAYTALDSADQTTTKGTKVSKNVTDDYSSILYNTIFSIPTNVSFGVNITIGRGSFLGTDSELQNLVKEAIKAWAHGESPFVDGLKIGQSIYSFEVGAAVSDAIPSIQVRDCAIVTNPGSTPETTAAKISLFIYEVGVLSESSISVVVQ